MVNEADVKVNLTWRMHSQILRSKAVFMNIRLFTGIQFSTGHIAILIMTLINNYVDTMGLKVCVCHATFTSARLQ
jgi:hypothetical protein